MASRRSGILLVTTGLDVGGAEVQLASLAVKLSTRGWQVEVVSLLPPQALEEQLVTAGVAVHTLAMRRGQPDPRAIGRLAHHYRRLRPAVVHSHMVHANLLARVTRLVEPVDLQISTAHNIDEGGRKMDLAYKLTDFACELTTNVSKAGWVRYHSVGAIKLSKSLFIPNGVDLTAFAQQECKTSKLRREFGLGNAFVWLAVGRFRRQKDYPNMLRAFAAKPRDSFLLICGDGELLAENMELARSLDVHDRVRFLGLRTDIPKLMSTADGFLLSSAWEGLPLVLLEAAASGLPMVATDVGGNGDIVTPSSGILVPPRNYRALAGAITTMEMAEPPRRREMGEAARKHVHLTYDMERVVDTWELVYRHGIELSSGRRRCSFDIGLDRLQAKLSEADLA